MEEEKQAANEPAEIKLPTADSVGVAAVVSGAVNAALPTVVSEARDTVDGILKKNPDSVPGKIAKSVLDQPWSRNVGVTPTFIASVMSAAKALFSSTFAILVCLFGFSFMAWGMDVSAVEKNWSMIVLHSFFIVGIFRCLWLVYTKKKDKIGESVINFTEGLR